MVNGQESTVQVCGLGDFRTLENLPAGPKTMALVIIEHKTIYQLVKSCVPGDFRTSTSWIQANLCTRVFVCQAPESGIDSGTLDRQIND